jgi:hypothetical protein
MGHSRAVRRLVGLVAVGGLILAGTAAPATAKTPPFTLVVERSGARREIVTIVVKFEDRQHGGTHRDGLLGLYPAEAATNAGRLDPAFARTGYRAIPLTESRAGAYTGRLKLAPGGYAIVPFPSSADFPLEQAGYPAPRVLTVKPSRAHAS